MAPVSWPEPGTDLTRAQAVEVLSLALSSALGDLAVELWPCDYCRQPAGAPCVTASGRRLKTTHGARWWAVRALSDGVADQLEAVLADTWGMTLRRGPA